MISGFGFVVNEGSNVRLFTVLCFNQLFLVIVCSLCLISAQFVHALLPDNIYCTESFIAICPNFLRLLALADYLIFL